VRKISRARCPNCGKVSTTVRLHDGTEVTSCCFARIRRLLSLGRFRQQSGEEVEVVADLDARRLYALGEGFEDEITLDDLFDVIEGEYAK
jgi:hypothetical protein